MKTANSLKNVFGPLWNLYNDPNVCEISIDSFDEVYYAHKEGIKSANKIFKTPLVLNQLVARFQKLSNGANYFQLTDQTTVNIVLPPIAMKGPSLVIMKMPKNIFTLDDLIKFKALTADGKKIIENIISKNKGFLVAGNMGSGKNTLMNILIDMIPQPLRVVTLERYPDFNLKREKVCRLQAPTNKVSEMIDLVETAERMRADFLVISDFQGPEILPFLDLVRSHCDGAALIKGENPLDALKNLENKAVLASGGLSLEDVRYMIAQAFKHIIFQERRENGSRIVKSISEIRFDGGELKLKVIYKG